jgi:Glyoxalase/Bleomycin resistance protein/Dioxygenase superfamily
VQWELIEPLDEESVYARFLAEEGEGVQHVAVATPDFDDAVAQAARGNGVILSGEFGGARVAYLRPDVATNSTIADLGRLSHCTQPGGSRSSPPPTRRRRENPPLDTFAAR